ncbi:MAG: aminotransferase class III-fold pyridoxal phosphate-dependent enzyme, partial [Planctomycetota bacterium]
FAPYPSIHDCEEAEQLEREQESLDVVRTKLETGKIFAVLIEPMQCEGGERYASARFHQQLNQLVRSMDIPLIYDEVQTGSHLGDRFFWHTGFELKDASGNPIGPTGVACAKKTQVGVAINKYPSPFRETFCPAALIRGYASAFTMLQYSDKIDQIEKQISNRLDELTSRHDELIRHPRNRGLAFSFDLNNKEVLANFIKKRFDRGLLFYPAGTNTARFRLNLSFSTDDIDLLFNQIEDCISGSNHTNPSISLPDLSNVDANYRFCENMVQSRVKKATYKLELAIEK